MKDKGSKERGYASVLIVGMATVLLLFLGISVDWGILLRYRRAMQNACDSGALAGALNLRTSPGTAAERARWYAERDMTQNGIQWDTITATTLDDNNQPDGVAPRRIRVEIGEDVPTYLFRLVRDSVLVRVDCTARLTNIILADGLVPLGLNYEAWAPNYNPESGQCAEYVQDGVPLDERPAPCDSFSITYTIGASGDNPWGSGNSGLLSMDDDCFDCPGGAAQWRDNFINGSQNQYCYDQEHTAGVTDYTLNGLNCANVQTKPGVNIGPLRQAVNARCNDPNPLRRIIMMPLLNPAYSDEGSGRYTVEIWGFAAYELDCDNPPMPGAGEMTIQGGFVSIVSAQFVGRETTFDTGVYTIKLIE